MQLKTDATGIVATVEFYPATLQNYASATLGTERRHLEPMFSTRRIHQPIKAVDGAGGSRDVEKHLERVADQPHGSARQSRLSNARQSLSLTSLQARICYAKRSYGEALQLYQRILRLSPYSNPDPRIGTGLCQWQLGNRDRAKAAWQRSLQLVRAADSYS